jgi:hypothetical protein
MSSVQLFVGRKVICVDDRPRGASGRTDEALPRKGIVYTVREILRWKEQKVQYTEEDGLLVTENLVQRVSHIQVYNLSSK